MNLLDFKDKLFNAAIQEGFSEVELYFEGKEVFGCQIYKGEIDQYEIAEDNGISFRGLLNERMGYAYTEKVDEESILYLVENAKENSLVIQEDDKEEIFVGSKSYTNSDFYSNALNEITIPEKIQLLKDIEKEILAYDPRIVGTDYCLIKSESITRFLLNSKGLSLNDRMNYLYIVVEVIVKDEGETKTGIEYKITKDFYSLNPKVIAKKAAEEALSQLGSKNIESKNYPVLLRNNAAASLLATFASNFSAENTQAGISLLKGKEGYQIANEKVHMIDNPFLKDGLASKTFDSEGVATRETPLVEKGILKTLLHNHKTAKKDETETTGHAHKDSYKSAVKVGPSNLYIEPTSITFEEMVATIKEGVMIIELSGLHSGANPVSGDFSVAAKGYLIKDGRIEYPVNLMTIAGNFYELLMNVEEIGADLSFPLSGIGSPSIFVKTLSVTVE